MIVKRKIIKINEELCDGCGQCIPSCAEGALQIVDGKAKIVKDMYCDGLGACLGECPNGALKIIEREAEEFDEKAVHQYLATQKPLEPEKKLACGCPSSQIQTFIPSLKSAAGNESQAGLGLTHWPVKIRLIPPNAPFLKNADLLVVADCTPAADPFFHRDLAKGKVVMMGCPKFDEVQEYIQKFAQIFKTANLKSITCAYMDVPCCSALPMIVKKALEASGVAIPVKDIVITRKGEKQVG